jgi:hypothetical protein
MGKTEQIIAEQMDWRKRSRRWFILSNLIAGLSCDPVVESD